MISMMLLAVLIFPGTIFFTIRHWARSTVYFKGAFVCGLLAFWGYIVWAIAQMEGSCSSTACIGYLFIGTFATWISCAVWRVVWLSGFLCAKIINRVSNNHNRSV